VPPLAEMLASSRMQRDAALGKLNEALWLRPIPDP